MKSTDAIQLEAGEEYYVFRIRFGNPPVGCGGCELPACFVLNSLVLRHSGRVEETEMDYYTNFASWRGGTQDCPFIVPARAASWGRIKAERR